MISCDKLITLASEKMRRNDLQLIRTERFQDTGRKAQSARHKIMFSEGRGDNLGDRTFH